MLSFLLHPPTPELYTLSLHDALPICAALAQDPQAAAGNDAQHVFAIDGIELIAAAAQEREVVLQEPGEEGALLVVPVRRQPRYDLGHARLHRLPVLDRRAHVGENPGDARLQLGELRRIGLAVDLDG